MKWILQQFVFISALSCSQLTFAYTWSEGEKIPAEGLSNPYNIQRSELAQYQRQGLIHALNYPIEVSGSLLPYDATYKLFKELFGSYDMIGKILGLHQYPEEEGEGAYYIPFLEGERPQVRMGVSKVPGTVDGLTFSCAACHSATLFGKRVMGLQNRFPRSNEAFYKGQKALKTLPSKVFQAITNASDLETALFKRTKKNLSFVESKTPSALGLDTSLAHVALSLSHRAKDSWATKTKTKTPRYEPLRHIVADSKPGVWWNVKFKNRWLLDGSVVSGNPVYTNLLWNEIGRGTNLKEFDLWLKQNTKIIEELTTAVYETTPPLITDFFDESYFDIESAKRGEQIFEARCTKCHGQYIKGWSLDGSKNWSLAEQLKTHQLKYFKQTPVKNVGTDPLRRMGMRSLLQLNDLEIAKQNNIKIKMSKGYVPPPLLGIWARYPYFHNNSVASLCEVIGPENERRTTYLAREAKDKNIDFDFSCNGYPKKNKLSLKDRLSPYFFDTRKSGLSNKGHQKMFQDKQGNYALSKQDRKDLVHYLQLL